MLSSIKCVAAPLAAVMLLASTAGSQPAAAFDLGGTSQRRRRPRRRSHLFTATAAAAVGAVADIGADLAPASRSWVEIIVGGALVAAAVAEHRASGDDMRRCARDFPNFDPRSGTYENRHGEVLVCPYLH